MKLREFLNQIYDETWVKIKVSKRKKFDLWMADYIGWYEPVMKDIEPYLDRDIVDEVYTTIEEDPENEGEEAAVICVELCSAKDSKRRADSELLDALIKAVKEYDNLRDREWDFETDLPNRDMWPDDACKEYDTLLKDIETARKTVNKLIVEATGKTYNTLQGKAIPMNINTSRAKYSITFAFICDDGNTVGTAPAHEMRYGDLGYALAMVDPFNHEKWMGQVNALRRRGDHMVITMTSASKDRGTVGRAIKIQRV